MISDENLVVFHLVFHWVSRFIHLTKPKADPSHQFTTVQDIIRLEENQLKCVKGILTLRPDSVQQIPMKHGYLVSVEANPQQENNFVS